MLFSVVIGIVIAILLVFFGKYFKNNFSYSLAVIPLGIFIFYLSKISYIRDGNVLFESTPWVSSLLINLSFRLDGLSLLFVLLISGIGFLIFIYSSSYLRGHKYLDRFLGFLLLFMSSMLGLVLANNVLILFIFWELTSISSYFLIGFNNEKIENGKSALTSFAITGVGGLFLVTGLIFAGNLVGSYELGVFFENAHIIKNSTYYPLILSLVLLGAFTKSAQFPFYFWLPKAMAAPTPVSAYLHSATMVKAGIYILARFMPILGGTLLWKWSLMGVGGFTMLYAASLSITKTDLKTILAYSTVSALGMLTFLLGIGTSFAIIAAGVFLLSHALYKAPLFLVAGIIDHETGTRDVNKLRGLAKVLLPVAIAGGLAAFSSAGIPLTFGFIGKDLIYDATLHEAPQWAWYLTGLALATNVCLVVAGFLVGLRPFIGKLDESFQKLTSPHFTLWMPPFLLALLGLIFGAFPGWVGSIFTAPFVKSVMQTFVPVDLKIWHGLNWVFMLSLATIISGAILFFVNKPRAKPYRIIAFFDSLKPENVFTHIFIITKQLASAFTNYFHNGYLRSYLIKIILFIEILLIYELNRGSGFSLDFQKLSPIRFYDVAIAGILLLAVYKTLKTSSRLTAVVSMSIVGYSISLLFVIYSAPDLAMTQFTIDTLTVVLFVLVLYKLPPFLKFKNQQVMIRDGVVSVIFGVLLALICLRVLQEPAHYNISEFYAKYAYTLGKGRNVVNVILVDFRGIDTMFEIVVLSIAAIGVYSLLKLKLKSSEKE